MQWRSCHLFKGIPTRLAMHARIQNKQISDVKTSESSSSQPPIQPPPLLSLSRPHSHPRTHPKQHHRRADQGRAQHQNLHKRILPVQHLLDEHQLVRIAPVKLQRAIDVNAAPRHSQRGNGAPLLPAALVRGVGQDGEADLLEGIGELGGVVELPVDADVVVGPQGRIRLVGVDGGEKGVVGDVDAAARGAAYAACVAVGGGGHVAAEGRRGEDRGGDVEDYGGVDGRVRGTEVRLAVIALDFDLVHGLCGLGLALEGVGPPCMLGRGCETCYLREIAGVRILVGGEWRLFAGDGLG